MKLWILLDILFPIQELKDKPMTSLDDLLPYKEQDGDLPSQANLLFDRNKR